MGNICGVLNSFGGVLYFGGNSNNRSNAGLFYFNNNRTTNYDMNIGARLS